MTEARLLATNPENSSLVPVACNAQGQILIADVEIRDISNDVNLGGDLTVTGSGSFAGNVDIGGTRIYGSWGLQIDSGTADSGTAIDIVNNGASTAIVHQDGSAEFSGQVYVNRGLPSSNTSAAIEIGNSSSSSVIRLGNNGSSSFSGALKVSNDNPNSSNNIWLGLGAHGTPTAFNYDFVTIGAGGKVIAGIRQDGSCIFAAGKAGFTAEGYLWCTTERGDTVYLQATSNGIGSWAAYTPEVRGDLIKDKLEEWSEKDEPAES